MRAKVREVQPSATPVDADELVAEQVDVALRAPASHDVGGAAREQPASYHVHVVEHGRPLTANDLGPNGDVVLDLLSRAAALTADECRRLDREAAWRWGVVTPVSAVASLPVARSVALVRGRRDGRSEAIVALETAVASLMHDRSRRRTGSRVAACISNAGLAVLVRDLVESDTFETLFGAWREVMHH